MGEALPWEMSCGGVESVSPVATPTSLPPPTPQLLRQPLFSQQKGLLPPLDPMPTLTGRPASSAVLPWSPFLSALGHLQIVPLPETLPAGAERPCPAWRLGRALQQGTHLPRHASGPAAQAGPSQGRREMWKRHSLLLGSNLTPLG